MKRKAFSPTVGLATGLSLLQDCVEKQAAIVVGQKSSKPARMFTSVINSFTLQKLAVHLNPKQIECPVESNAVLAQLVLTSSEKNMSSTAPVQEISTLQ